MKGKMPMMPKGKPSGKMPKGIVIVIAPKGLKTKLKPGSNK